MTLTTGLDIVSVCTATIFVPGKKKTFWECSPYINLIKLFPPPTPFLNFPITSVIFFWSPTHWQLIDCQFSIVPIFILWQLILLSSTPPPPPRNHVILQGIRVLYPLPTTGMFLSRRNTILCNINNQRTSRSGVTHSSDCWWQTSFDLMMVCPCRIRIIWARITAIDYPVTFKMVSLSRRKKSLPNTWYIPTKKNWRRLKTKTSNVSQLILTEMNTEWTRASFTNIWIYLHTYETRECRAWKKPLLSLCRLELNRCARNCVFRSSRSSSNFSKFESQLCCTCKSWLSFYNVIDILSYAASWFEMQNAKNAKWLLKYEP